MFLGLGIGLSAQAGQSRWSPAELFSSAAQGVFYPMIPGVTLFQDAAGTVPATSAGQPIGLCCDQSGLGHHASQSTSANRPILARRPPGGRRNLLITDMASAGYWSVNILAPQIRMQDYFEITNVNAGAGLYRSSIPMTAGLAITFSARFTHLAGAASSANMQIVQGTAFTSTKALSIDLQTGEVISATGMGTDSASYEVTPFAGGYLLKITATPATTGTTAAVLYAGGRSGIEGTVRCSEPQLEFGTVRTNFQRVVNDFDVTEAGVPAPWHLSFNGSTQWLQTDEIAWGSDEVSLISGIGLKGTSRQIGFEFGNDAAQSFRLEAPAEPDPVEHPPSSYRFASKGSAAPSSAANSPSFSVPITHVLGGLGTIDPPVQALRVNGTEVDRVTASQGTGDYGSHRVFIGSRGGTSLYFSGGLFPIVAINRLLSEAELAKAEAWVAARAGVTL